MCARACARVRACVCARVRENAGASSGARLRSTKFRKLHIVRQEAAQVILLYKIKARVTVFSLALV